MASISYERFNVNIPETVIVDLKERLRRSRWPIEPANSEWRYGTSLTYMKAVVDHWLHRFDWRVWESRINSFPNYVCSIDGKKLHFIMEQGSGRSPLPLLISHGWPGSIAEFLDIVEPLAHPERFGGDANDGFTVIAPSLPGYAFSEAPDHPISHRDIGSIFHRLMTEVLGFRTYCAQGGDVGAGITSWMAYDFSESLTAMHLNFVSFEPDVGALEMTDEEKAWKSAHDQRRVGEAGYQQIQGTKPLTLSYALTDSPVGLAAWILEKFHGWTVPGEKRWPPFDIDHLLCNVMLHWIPGPHAAMWTYLFSVAGTSRALPDNRRLTTPTGLLMCPQDIRVPPPESWVNRVYNVDYRRDIERGGHFAAFELGSVFVDEVRNYFRKYR